MLKKYEKSITIIILGGMLLFVMYFIGYYLWYHKTAMVFFQILLFLSFIIHYICTMGNQSIFYGYFQSWEWKPLWKDNNLQRVAGEHRSIIKDSIINCVFVIPMVIGILYALYHYKLLSFYEFEQIVWFDALWLEEYITNAWVLPVYWYILLGFTALFFLYLIRFFKKSEKSSNIINQDDISVLLDKTIPTKQKEYHKYTVRDIMFVTIFCSILFGYTILNTPTSFNSEITGLRAGPLAGPFYIVIWLPIFGYSYHLKRVYHLSFVVALLWFVWLFVIYMFYIKEYSLIVVSILKYVIPISLVGAGIVVLLSLGVVIWSWIFRRKDVDSMEYDELNKTMKPWLGFNGRFVSESYINGNQYSFQELYEITNSKKKWLFWLEYFFANILNRNVSTLLQQKKLLWFKAIFNDTNDNKSKKMDPAYPSMALTEDDLKKRKKILETQPTRMKSRIEDPEGDVFLSLELEREEVENRNPSIWLPFYVTGVIYLTVLPYFVVYNAVMLVIFTKFVQYLYTLNIELLNILVYGFIGVQGLIFLGFLLAIFANNMGVWLAWRKYYRLKEQGNAEALFFSIFKQRVLYQYIYEYSKNEEGEVVTNNYELGLYPQINLEIIDEVAKELSPKYYNLYSKKFPLYNYKNNINV